MLKGHVVSGKGLGSLFLSKEGYKELIRDSLGFTPYEGTLNIKIEPRKKKVFLNLLKKTKIEPFIENNERFGGILCFKAQLNSLSGAIIVPEKTRHTDDIVEFISIYNLREKLNLKDGDIVVIKEDN